MTYLTLLLGGLLPPIVVLLFRDRHHDLAPAVPLRHQVAALITMAGVAVGSTLPWDAALISRGTWSYPHAQVVAWVSGVPVEELVFMVLQPLLVGAWLRGLPAGSIPGPAASAAAAPGASLRVMGTSAWLCLSVAGAWLLLAVPAGSYLGWLLVWAGPLLGVQWAVAGDRIWAHRRLLLPATVPPVLYLCALDRLALHLQLWRLSPLRTSGAGLLGLPVEEGTFFTLTTLLVVSGLLLVADEATVDRLRGYLGSSARTPGSPLRGPTGGGVAMSGSARSVTTPSRRGRRRVARPRPASGRLRGSKPVRP